jgi:Arc/MetJ-type ribon-helix-helix transcriptional regulator
MPRKELDASQIVSVRLPNDLLQRLDRYLDWRATFQRRPATRNAAIREALSAWLDHQEQLAGLREPQALRRQFQATYNSLRHPQEGVPIHQLRQLLQWPRERFDAVLEALRAEHHVDLEVLQEHAFDGPAIQDSYHVHGQLYGRIRWRD